MAYRLTDASRVTDIPYARCIFCGCLRHRDNGEMDRVLVSGPAGTEIHAFCKDPCPQLQADRLYEGSVWECPCKRAVIGDHCPRCQLSRSKAAEMFGQVAVRVRNLRVMTRVGLLPKEAERMIEAMRERLPPGVVIDYSDDGDRVEAHPDVFPNATVGYREALAFAPRRRALYRALPAIFRACAEERAEIEYAVRYDEHVKEGDVDRVLAEYDADLESAKRYLRDNAIDLDLALNNYHYNPRAVAPGMARYVVATCAPERGRDLYDAAGLAYPMYARDLVVDSHDAFDGCDPTELQRHPWFVVCERLRDTFPPPRLIPLPDLPPWERPSRKS